MTENEAPDKFIFFRLKIGKYHRRSLRRPRFSAAGLTFAGAEAFFAFFAAAAGRAGRPFGAVTVGAGVCAALARAGEAMPEAMAVVALQRTAAGRA